jgi:hypothetical protein
VCCIAGGALKRSLPRSPGGSDRRGEATFNGVSLRLLPARRQPLSLLVPGGVEAKDWALGVDVPLYWTIDSKQRLFTGGGEGVVTFADAMSLLEALIGANALSYRKLFDGRAVQSAMTAEEVLALCVHIRARHAKGAVGALAMVGTDEQTVIFARLLGALASADRPMKVFTTMRAARAWLDKQQAT